MTDTAVRVTIHGRVQGVFFRASTRREAEAHGVRGWVQNDPEGTVTAHLEGEPEDVERVLAWIAAGGPAQARVDRVERRSVDPEGSVGFDVRG